MAGRHLLLVLDNCEHLLPAMPLVGELLAASPGLNVLATSRARLRLRGERELPVAPLAVPVLESSAVPPVAELADVPAVRLFAERAAEVRPGFALSVDNAPAVAAICRQVEGLPLALELAAARVKILPPEMLRIRLAQRLPLLSGGARDAPERQQTMRDAIAWSHDLLGEEEQSPVSPPGCLRGRLHPGGGRGGSRGGSAGAACPGRDPGRAGHPGRSEPAAGGGAVRPRDR